MASSKYRDFMERAFGSDVLAGDRHIGFAAVTGGDAPGTLGKPNWSLKAGIFSTSLQDGNPRATPTSTLRQARHAAVAKHAALFYPRASRSQL